MALFEREILMPYLQNTCAVEMEVQRLGRIIQQQSKIILNQRYQLALQELQNEYLEMIEANTEASAYFAATACLQNIVMDQEK